MRSDNGNADDFEDILDTALAIASGTKADFNNENTDLGQVKRVESLLDL